MKTNSRRKFIRNTSFTATGLFLTSVTKAKNDSVVLTSIGCAPNKLLSLYGTISSVKSGLWSDPATWGGKVPSLVDTPLINTGHTITYDLATSTVAGVNVNLGATLRFDPSKSATLMSNKNVVIQGTLEIKPTDFKNTHTLRFIDINEKNMVGRGHEVIASDTGLWVMNSGRLDIVGTEKKAWTRISGSVSAGSKTIQLTAPANGWSVGDEIVICPTKEIREYKYFEDIKALFEVRKIESISSTSITLDTNLAFDHAKVQSSGGARSWTAEVLNLSRNVKIEGTATGRSHVLIKSSSPHRIKNVAFQHMGPRRDQNGDGIDDFVPGRYALHFHHSMDGSRGTRVENCVCYDIGSHSYVPHMSHGIYFKDCVAFNVLDTAFWWDKGDITHDVTYDGCLVAFASYVDSSVDFTKDMNNTTKTRTSSSFLLGMGDGNSCINCVAVAGALCGRDWNAHSPGAYAWGANNEGVWVFENCLAHSSRNGLRVWQNTKKNHTIINYESYNNNFGVFLGAYMNSYTFRGGYHYNSQVDIEASSANTSGVRFERIVFDGADMLNYPVIVYDSPIETLEMDSDFSNKFLNCTFQNYKIGPALGSSGTNANDDGSAGEGRTRKILDFIHCEFNGKLPSYDGNAENGCYMRIQPKIGQSKKIAKEGTPDLNTGTVKSYDIAPFAPKVWGVGLGLKGEYFANTDNLETSKKVFTRTDSILGFFEWDVPSTENPAGFHHKLMGDVYSVRWSGKIMAQYSEEYTFRCNSAGGTRLWVNGEQLVDAWGEAFNTSDRFASISKPIKLVAGQIYDIVVEHNNTSRYRGFILNWKCDSMAQYVIVPQSQLYAGAIAPSTNTEETAANKGPIANAGTDVEITLPIDNVTLNGNASFDTDGKIASYLWTKVSGPSQFSITDASAVTTGVKGLIAGEYVFRLEVKDDKNTIATDDVKVIVKEKEVEGTGLIVKAGTDTTLTLPKNSFTLDGSSSSNASGQIVSYKWSKVSGPTQFTITSSTAAVTTVNNLVEGTYVFKLQVTDDKGLSASDEVMITVNPEIVNKKPIAIAGDDVSITLPTSDTSLNASASSDDGKIVAYKWTKVSGPDKFKIANSLAATTSISELIEGKYVFRIQVTDDKGAIAADDMAVMVEPVPIEKRAPKVNAGNDITITAPSNNVKVTGTATFDTGTAFKSCKWTKISGPSRFKIVSPGAASTVINQLTEGVYHFEFEVEDMTGAKGKDDVVVTVLPKKENGQNNVSTNNTKQAEALTVSASPNPSSSSFKLHINSNSDKNINVKLFDRWGKEVGNIRNVKPSTTITIPSNLKKGSYFGVIEQGFQKKTITLVKI